MYRPKKKRQKKKEKGNFEKLLVFTCLLFISTSPFVKSCALYLNCLILTDY